METVRGQRAQLSSIIDASTGRLIGMTNVPSIVNEFTISKSVVSEFAMPKRETNIQETSKEGVWDTICRDAWNGFVRRYCDNIIAIKEIVPNKVYEYTFGDEDVQKTVCSESDQFSMEDSITIAYAKHFMGGSGKYNRAVDKAMKLFTNQKAAEEKAKKEAEAAKVRQEKKAKKKAERIARKRETEIELQAEAYRRAMQSIAEERSNRKFEKHKKPKEK